MQLIKFIVLSLRFIIESLKNRYLLFKYRILIRPAKKKVDVIGHVLIVKNLAYVDISINSVLSFLYYNENSTVIVHCDESCRKRIFEKYSKEIAIGRIEVRVEMVEPYWQISKLKIFNSLPDESHCMFDVDTRWNGRIELESGVSYVSHFEFEFVNKSPWRWIVAKHLNLNHAESYLMLNTSFIRKGKLLKLNSSYLDEVFEKIFNIIDCDEIGREDLPGVIRIAEQVAISIYMQSKDSRIKALVCDGSPKSGLIFETTYYGATGNRF